MKKTRRTAKPRKPFEAEAKQVIRFLNSAGLTMQDQVNASRYFVEIIANEDRVHIITAMSFAMEVAKAESVIRDWHTCKSCWPRQAERAS